MWKERGSKKSIGHDAKIVLGGLSGLNLRPSLVRNSSRFRSMRVAFVSHEFEKVLMLVLRETNNKKKSSILEDSIFNLLTIGTIKNMLKKKSVSRNWICFLWGPNH